MTGSHILRKLENAQQKVLEIIEAASVDGRLPGSNMDAKLNCQFMESGVVDSMGIVTIITELETSLGVSFEAEDMHSEAFQTPRGIAELVHQKSQ